MARDFTGFQYFWLGILFIYLDVVFMQQYVLFLTLTIEYTPGIYGEDIVILLTLFFSVIFFQFHPTPFQTLSLCCFLFLVSRLDFFKTFLFVLTYVVVGIVFDFVVLRFVCGKRCFVHRITISSKVTFVRIRSVLCNCGVCIFSVCISFCYLNIIIIICNIIVNILLIWKRNAKKKKSFKKIKSKN